MVTERAFEEAFVGAGDLLGKIGEKGEDGRLGIDLRDIIDAQVVSAHAGRWSAADLFEKNTVQLAGVNAFLATGIYFQSNINGFRVPQMGQCADEDDGNVIQRSERLAQLLFEIR